eukprot:1130621-Rhodomonas_salina.1
MGPDMGRLWSISCGTVLGNVVREVHGCAGAEPRKVPHAVVGIGGVEHVGAGESAVGAAIVVD